MARSVNTLSGIRVLGIRLPARDLPRISTHSPVPPCLALWWTFAIKGDEVLNGARDSAKFQEYVEKDSKFLKFVDFFKYFACRP